MNLRKWFGGGGGTSKKEKPTPKVVQIDMNMDHDPSLMKKLNYNPEHKVDKIGNKARELPANFSRYIIEYEIKVDRPDASQEHVQKLIDLYTVSLTACPIIEIYSILRFYINIFNLGRHRALQQSE